MNSDPADDRPTLAELGEPAPLPWHGNHEYDCRRCELDQAAAEAEEECEHCGGLGWFEGPPAHHPSCDGNCQGLCPIQTQVQCTSEVYSR